MSDGAPTTTAAPATAPVPDAPAAPAGEQAPATEAQQAAVAEYRRKVKANGREVEFTDKEVPPWMRDLVGEERAIDLARLGTTAWERIHETAKARKQLEEAAGDLRDTKRAMSLLVKIHGEDGARQLVEDWYAADMKRRAMSPEERERADKETALDKKEREIREREEVLQKEQQQRATQQWRERFAKGIESAITETKLPKHPKVITMIADRMHDAIAAQHPITAKQAAEDVREELAEINRSVLGSDIDPDVLEQIVGDGNIKKLHKRAVEKLQATQPRTTGGQYAPPATKAAPAQKRRAADLFEERRKGR